MENNLKIYVVCHKRVFVPKCQYLVPIQVGCDIARDVFENYVHDNTGDNISYKNPDYCELTALYWVWKNDNSPYIGLFHYRRFLALNDKRLKHHLDYWKHFYNLEALTQKSFDNLGFSNVENIHLIQNYDILIPKCSELKFRNIENFYALYKRANLKAELDYALKIVVYKYPEYQMAVDMCMTSNKGYHCNMFIMKREVLREYCEWLFPVLDTMYDDIKNGTFVTEKKRLIGYIAEFMMGIFICKKRNELKIKELPAVYFNYTDGKSHFVRTHVNSIVRRVYRLVFPVGSIREMKIFKLLDKVRGD